jgi:hypothetical protein
MKLYRSSEYSSRWFAFSPLTGWLMFPAEIGGWTKRVPAGEIEWLDVREVPLWLGFNTGIIEAAAALDYHPPLAKAA